MSADPQDWRDRTLHEARRAAFTLARDSGARVVTRPLFRTSDSPAVRDIEPLAGAHAARDLELAANEAARDYIGQARETGHDWDQIGRALCLSADGGQAVATRADAAYTYAAGTPETTAPSWPRTFGWTCRTCDQQITDRGPVAGPADAEQGHARNCPRLARSIALWNAGWEAEP
jgi:hypothetical protein